jgi:hypothetical protein
MGRRGNVLINGWSRMDCKGQWEYGVKQYVSYGGNSLRVRERRRKEQKEGETYKQFDRVKVNVRWPDVERVSGEREVTKAVLRGKRMKSIGRRRIIRSGQYNQSLRSTGPHNY